MKLRVAINGFGRVGRLFFRNALEKKEIELVAINDLGDLENLAYLLKYDSVYKTYETPVRIEPAPKDEKEGGSLFAGGHKIAVYKERDPHNLPWGDLEIDVVVEATGVFDSFEKASVHLTSGAKRVVLSAPSKTPDGLGGQTVLIGINEENFRRCSVSSNGSCTTNAVSPVMQIMSEEIGVKKAMLSTIHGYTSTQGLVDGVSRSSDYRRGRAAAQNIIPSTTGAAISTTRAIIELQDKFDGIALRVPVIAGSIADLTMVTARKTNAEEINGIFRKAAEEPRWQGILKVVEDPIVSSDIIGEPYGAIVDLSYTKVVDQDLVKVLSWYDNEWGYSTILVEHVIRAGRTI